MSNNIYENLKKHISETENKIKELEKQIELEKDEDKLEMLNEMLQNEKENYEFYLRLKKKTFYIS